MGRWDAEPAVDLVGVDVFAIALLIVYPGCCGRETCA